MGVAKGIFIPHHTNNHWPLALRHRTLAYVSSFLIVAKIVTIAALALTPSTAELSTITEGRMVQLTNEARTKAGLLPLTVNSNLAQAAKLKGQDMLKNQYFAHISPTGVTPWFWMKKTGYTYEIAGENLAIDFLSAEDVVSAWLASPTHKANLLQKEYTQTGIAIVSGEFQGGTSIIVVHMFGKPLRAEASEPTPTPTTAPETTPSPVQTKTPEATLAPSPVPTAAPTQSPQNTAPRTPRIALINEPKHPDDNVSFRIEGDKQSSAILFIGNQERAITTLPDSGVQTISIPANRLPKGTLIARVSARSVAGIESKPSAPISFINPSESTSIAKQYTLILNPAFDRQQIALTGGTSSDTWQLFSLGMPIAINAQTVNAEPSFAIRDNASQHFSATITHVTRQATSLILISIIVLLILAIVIRIEVQHPSLIAHASLVIFLAVILLIA